MRCERKRAGYSKFKIPLVDPFHPRHFRAQRSSRTNEDNSMEFPDTSSEFDIQKQRRT